MWRFHLSSRAASTGFGFSVVMNSIHYHPPAAKWGRPPWLQVLDWSGRLWMWKYPFFHMVPAGKTAPVVFSVFMGWGCCHQEVPGLHHRVELFAIKLPLVQITFLLTSWKNRHSTAWTPKWLSENPFPIAYSFTIAGQRVPDISFDEHHLNLFFFPNY